MERSTLKSSPLTEISQIIKGCKLNRNIENIEVLKIRSRPRIIELYLFFSPIQVHELLKLINGIFEFNHIY